MSEKDPHNPPEPMEQRSSKKDFIIVGLGASAGGVQSLREFFSAMPPDSGMAFVVILHLSPQHESNLPDILQNVTEMPVAQVTETVTVEPNHVYVIPPDKNLGMMNGSIRLTQPDERHGPRVAIDRFFRTLADSYGKNSVCVILSGTGSDGTLGLKQIKERDGFAIVQDPDDAEYDGMPRSAIATRLADWILPVAEMPAKLIKFRKSSERLNLTNGAETAEVKIEGADELREILTMIRIRTGHDFANYKQPTILRRVARHLQARELEDIPSYIALLRKQPEELNSLIKNLLINVTNFFRDPKAFNALEKEVIPRIFAGKSSKDSVRAWSVGCASGEEAYSLGMLLSEYADTLDDPPKIQIFATDVDDDAIAEAREHRYPLTIEADVSPERLRRFFVRENDQYVVRESPRQMVLFAVHNVLRDPPFSKLDLIVCRNLLIYLNRETQDQVLQIFHFALRRNGFLFLGSSESAEGQSALFSTVDKKNRVYVRRDVAPQLVPVPPMKSDWRVRLPELPREHGHEPTISFGEIHHKVLEQYGPPSVLVNEDFEIVHLSESAGRYLRFSGGEPSNDLLKAVHPDLGADLRAALFTTQHEHKTSEFRDIRVVIDGNEALVNLIVRYIDLEKAGNFLLVMFDENARTPTDRKKSDQPIHPNKDDAMQTVARRLEDDLRRTKDRLRATIEQHETSIEELKASNEELQAVNEEMRSASEELETSKEELQSVNEELTTVNHELKDKVDELSRVNSDLQNLMVSTDIGTIFLDRELRIKFYTPRAQQLFNIIPGDIGRPLEHLTHKLNYETLVPDSSQVLETLQPIEREILDKDGLSYMLRILPYKTLDNKIDGIVITIVDTTGLRRAEETIAQDLKDTRMLQELGMRLLSENNIQVLSGEITTAAMTLMDADAGTVQILDQDSNELLMLSARNIPGKLSEYLERIGSNSSTSCGTALAKSERSFIDFEKPGPDPDDACRVHLEAGFVSAQSTPLVTRSGKLIGMLTTHWRRHHRPAERELRFLDLLVRQAADLIEHRRSEQSIRESDRLKDEFLATLSHELRNPLAPIRSALEIITRKKASKKDADRALETIERQTGQIVRLVDDLLDMSRISQGKITLRKEVVDLSKVLDMAIEATRERIRSKNQVLTVTKSEKPVFLEADFTRLAQIVINLLGNASKYTDPGGSIWISSQVENNQVVVRVIDNGRGITADKLSWIFDMFNQSDSDSSQEGLGVGLSLVKKLVELHNGTIEVYSDGPGKGSEFVVKLPIVIPLGFVRKRGALPKAAAGEKPRNPKKILIIDDNIDAVEMLSVLLHQDEDEVEAAYDGKDGVDLALRFNPDVILLDIGLPKLDGYEVARRIRKKLPKVYLIAISGWGQEQDVKRSLEAGFDRHLVKPVEFEELRSILEEVDTQS